MNDYVPEGTTLPTEGGDKILTTVMEQFPTARAVLIITADKVEIMTKMPVKMVIGILAEYIYQMSKEMGMPE